MLSFYLCLHFLEINIHFKFDTCKHCRSIELQCTGNCYEQNKMYIQYVFTVGGNKLSKWKVCDPLTNNRETINGETNGHVSRLLFVMKPSIVLQQVVQPLVLMELQTLYVSPYSIVLQKQLIKEVAVSCSSSGTYVAQIWQRNVFNYEKACHHLDAASNFGYWQFFSPKRPLISLIESCWFLMYKNGAP